jgi:hypothetical protein
MDSILAAAYFCKGIPNKDFCDCNLRVTRYFFLISLLPGLSDL